MENAAQGGRVEKQMQHEAKLSAVLVLRYPQVLYFHINEFKWCFDCFRA